MSKDEYLITDAPLKALTVFAMPMILGSFFQQVYNMADSIIVGQFVGSSALAAVGACAALTNVFICVALGAGVGAGELVSRYSGRVYALAFAVVRDAQRADDVTQETFIRAYEHLDGFRGASAFATWLYRIAYNRAVGECRRRFYGRLDAESCAVAEERPAERFDEETVGRMHRALARLAPDERALVTLFYEDERSVAEIAQIMDLTLSNVKVRLHRVRGRIRQYMEE